MPVVVLAIFCLCEGALENSNDVMLTLKLSRSLWNIRASLPDAERTNRAVKGTWQRFALYFGPVWPVHEVC